jgi:hypothetical protein
MIKSSSESKYEKGSSKKGVAETLGLKKKEAIGEDHSWGPETKRILDKPAKSADNLRSLT